MDINWNTIEVKWRKRWNDEKTFMSNPDEREKKFITVAYPYPNSPQHIGHGRTYTLADIHARFYRMQGYNVLFPMAFHYTGTPILGMARKIAEGDSKLIDDLKNLYKVPENMIEQFAEPIKIADYFHEEIKAGMIEMGYSIDWRREFTTIDPVYSKFIQWQINLLKEKNLIMQGTHPVGWCPKDQNPVSQHDTLGDVEPNFTEYVIIKFKLDDYVIPIATLRPETIFGMTNLWVNPDITYEKITIDGEKWIVSPECAYKLEFHNKKISRDGSIQGKDLIGKSVTTYAGESIIILPACFVKSDTGTGMVMSVPAHAPMDYMALVDLAKSNNYKDLNITPKIIIDTDKYDGMPSEIVIKKMGIIDQNDPKMAEATKEVYSAEFYGGKMGMNTGEFAGTKVEFAKDIIHGWLKKKNVTDIMMELDNSVKCRCGAECVVKILDNQWFLNYGDAEWKKSTKECFESMSILPQEIRPEFDNVIEWLRERACARQHGMGTKLPWDNDWIVESLSDSVIYMAYYIISKFVNDGVISDENLSDSFFNYVFLGKGDVEQISKTTKIDRGVIKSIRKEFLYFYPVDARHSGRDLVPNHLTFFVMNHVAVFPEIHRPKQIVVNGSVLMNGSKMSKSIGNTIPIRSAIGKYGADPIRLSIILSAELLQDADFNMDAVVGIQNKLKSFMNECHLKPEEIKEMNAEDIWIISRLQNMIAKVTESMSKMRAREAVHNILYAFDSDLAWYMKRTSAKNRSNVGILRHVHSTRVAMLSPFAPYVAEEMWEMLGNEGLASMSKWPESIPDKIDQSCIQSEELLKSTMNDIAKIIKLVKITPKIITIYVADDVKSKTYKKILSMVNDGHSTMNVIMKDIASDPEISEIRKNPVFVQKTIKDVLSEPVKIRNARMEDVEFDEKKFLTNELAGLVKAEFDADIQVFTEVKVDNEKSKHARPYKPAILIE